MQQNLSHQPVMWQEAVDAIITDPNGLYVDGTFGRGGHSRLLLSLLGSEGRLVAMDRDPDAQQEAKKITDARFEFIRDAFGNLSHHLAQSSVDGLLLDIGVSSPQIDNPERGFSFRHDGPLDMRMDPEQGLSAALFLEKASESEIAMIIRDLGEERFASKIAKAIVKAREEGGALKTTKELADLVKTVVKKHEHGQDPATRTFQALRIHVNGELEQLENALEASLALLKPEGRLAVISFHSLEDRIVKRFMQKHSRFVPDRRVPVIVEPEHLLKEVKRIKPSEQEVYENPRSRSAVLRVATRTDVVLPVGALFGENAGREND